MLHFAWMQPISENPSSLLLELGCIPAFTCVAAPLHQVETKELGIRGEFELGLYTGYVYGVRICVETTPLSVTTPDDERMFCECWHRAFWKGLRVGWDGTREQGLRRTRV